MIQGNVSKYSHKTEAKGRKTMLRVLWQNTASTITIAKPKANLKYEGTYRGGNHKAKEHNAIKHI